MDPIVGKLRRVVRGALRVGVIGAGFYFKNGWAAIGLAPLFTSLTGRCLFYFLLGINTRYRAGELASLPDEDTL